MSVSGSNTVYISLLAPFLLAMSSPAPVQFGDAGDPRRVDYNVIEFLLDDVGIDFFELYDDENQWPTHSEK